MIVDSICKSLLLEKSYVESVVASASRRYKSFNIKKTSGGNRRISTPSKELKAIQKFILTAILEKIPTHKCATAYKKNTSIKDNVKPHLNGKYFLCMDFKDFFHSIQKSDFQKCAKETNQLKEMSELDIKIIAEIIFKDSHLAQGAVTSPAVSNIICHKLDKEISALCEKNEVAYTRYADDLTLSCSNKNTLFKIEKSIKDIIKNIEYPRSIEINIEKTVHTSQKRRVIRTGLKITNNGEISIGREKKRRIRSEIHKWEKLNESDKKKLAGTLSFCKGVEPRFINSLYLKYGYSTIAKAISYK